MALFPAVAHTTVLRQLEQLEQHAQRLASSGARRGARQSERMRELERDLSDGRQDGGLDPRHAPEAGS